MDKSKQKIDILIMEKSNKFEYVWRGHKNSTLPVLIRETNRQAPHLFSIKMNTMKIETIYLNSSITKNNNLKNIASFFLKRLNSDSMVTSKP